MSGAAAFAAAPCSELLAPLRDHLAGSLDCDGRGARSDDLDLFDACAAFVRLRPGLVVQGRVAMSVEASLALRPGLTCSRRYIVGLPVAALGRSPWSDLEAWLDAAAAPADVRACLERLRDERELPTAIHLGFERAADATANRRFYVERRPLHAMLGPEGGPPTLAMVGAQWPVAGGPTRWRRYHEGRRATAPVLPGELARALERHPGAVAGYVWQRADLGPDASATDTYWHFRGWALADAVDALAALAERHCAMGEACAAALGRVPAGAHFKAVGLGQDSRGPRLKVYQAPGRVA
ncbi:MAG: hypothetical protein FJ100_11695 [Deltaproteobacteria bacterium]|nr:hypothetical protein [Deltaproteobacteria bacterium]